MNLLHQIFALAITGNVLCNNPVAAHSFNLLFIAPLSDSIGQSALDGFLLATTEQDSHDFETSDGHLGGLDSHVFRIDNAMGVASTTNQLKKTIAETGPIFATGLSLDANQKEWLKNSGAVVVDPASSRYWPDWLARREKLATMNGELFVDQFEQAYGYRPDRYATRGYIAARVIADVIRKSSEQDRFRPIVIEQMVRAALIDPSW